MKRIMLLYLIIIALLFGCSKEVAESEDLSDKDYDSESSLSGIVFIDENANGLFDSGEKGFEGVKITVNGAILTTDSNGKYEKKVPRGNASISIETASVPDTYTLTTGNDTQTINIEAESTSAKPIGYALKAAENSPSFEELLSYDRHDNYYFDLIVSTVGAPDSSMKLWVIGESYKSITQGITLFVNKETGKMGVYEPNTNQVIITPLLDDTPLMTPFTYIDELDKDLFKFTHYKGTTQLDNKSVEVFEYEGAGTSVTYYLWRDYHLILKVDTKVGDIISSFYFKDLAFDTVTMEDISYPAGAKVIEVK